jgi:hypothetical protein
MVTSRAPCAFSARRRAEPDGAAADDQAAGIGQRDNRGAAEPRRTPCQPQASGSASAAGFFKGHMIRYFGPGFPPESRSARQRRPGAEPSTGSGGRRRDCCAPARQSRGIAAGRQRIDGHPLALQRTLDDDAGGLVTKDQGRRAALVMAEIGMHVGAADADRLDPHQAFAGSRTGSGASR